MGWRHGFKQGMTDKLDLCFLFCQQEVIDTRIQAMFEVIQVQNLKWFGQLPIEFLSNLYKEFGAFTKTNGLCHFRYFNINQQVDGTNFILDFRFIVLLKKLIKKQLYIVSVKWWHGHIIVLQNTCICSKHPIPKGVAYNMKS